LKEDKSMKKMKITLGDLPPEYREFAEIVGFKAFMRLVDTYGGGSPVYIPKLSEVIRNRRNQEIIKGFTGENYLELAKAHGLSVMSVRRILKKHQG
jgi:Mor family transcriptional regulator